MAKFPFSRWWRYNEVLLYVFLLQPEPSEHSHLVNFAGLANFTMNKNGIYEEFQVRMYPLF